MKLTSKHAWFVAALVVFLAWVGTLAALAAVSSKGPAAVVQGNGD